MNNINLQIYPFGFDCGLSFLDKIRKAAELGYAGVELVREYEGIPAEDVVKVLEETGIKAVSAHVGLDAIEQDLPYLAKLGVRYVACPNAPFNTAEEAKELAAERYGRPIRDPHDLEPEEEVNIGRYAREVYSLRCRGVACFSARKTGAVSKTRSYTPTMVCL